MTGNADVVVVGAGVFGLTAAVELRRRGRSVVVLDAGPIPHPLAASTDRSKIVRLDYGADEPYTAWMEEALARWRKWPAALFRETGVLFLSRSGLRDAPQRSEDASSPAGGAGGSEAPRRRLRDAPQRSEDASSPAGGAGGSEAPRQGPGAGFESASLAVLRRRGHDVERLTAESIRARFPAWNADRFIDGYYNPLGGWVDSGAVVTWLASEARAAGVDVRTETPMIRLAEASGSLSAPAERVGARRVVGVVLADGAVVSAREAVVLATGSWTPHLCAETAPFLRSPAQPVFLLRPADPAPYAPERFPVWAADIARTGWYGFPAGDDGIVKVARHGPGRFMHPESPDRFVDPNEEAALRDSLRDAIPGLADAPLAGTRLCLYSDSPDGHFWISRDPEMPGLVLATGGSGHAFKFAPLLGEWIADAVEGKHSEPLRRFQWRPEVNWHNREEARFSG